jgi:hypothetical protein
MPFIRPVLELDALVKFGKQTDFGFITPGSGCRQHKRSSLGATVAEFSLATLMGRASVLGAALKLRDPRFFHGEAALFERCALMIILAIGQPNAQASAAGAFSRWRVPRATVNNGRLSAAAKAASIYPHWLARPAYAGEHASHAVHQSRRAPVGRDKLPRREPRSLICRQTRTGAQCMAVAIGRFESPAFHRLHSASSSRAAYTFRRHPMLSSGE